MSRATKRRRKDRVESAAAPMTDDQGRAIEGYTDCSFYADQKYWDERYTQTDAAKPVGTEPFEWFGPVEPLMPLMELLVPDKDASFVEFGCGTSLLLHTMHQSAGYVGRMIGFDYSETAVSAAAAAVASSSGGGSGGGGDGGGPTFACADGGDLTSIVPEGAGEDGKFDVWIEKGSLAALVSGEDGEALVERVLTEAHRVLRDGGMIVSISPHDPHDENEGTNGINVLEELVLPPLLRAAAGTGHFYTIDIHSSETFPESHVYVLRKRARAQTRSASSGHTTSASTIRCHEH